MKVKDTKRYIERMNVIFMKIDKFTTSHEELEDETSFLCDVVGYLVDYRSLLENMIDNAELKI